MIEKDKLLKRLTGSIEHAITEGDVNEMPSWAYQEGVLLSYHEAEYFTYLIEKDLGITEEDSEK